MFGGRPGHIINTLLKNYAGPIGAAKPGVIKCAARPYGLPYQNLYIALPNTGQIMTKGILLIRVAVSIYKINTLFTGPLKESATEERSRLGDKYANLPSTLVRDMG